MKGFLKKHQDILRDIWKDKPERIIMLAIAVFLLLNVMKLSLFNFLLIPNQNVGTFFYKLATTLLFVIIAYPFLFKIKLRIVYILFYLIQAVYIMVNISYYLYFHSYLHIAQSISLFYEGFKATQNASAPVSPILLIAVLDLPVFLYLLVKFHKAAGVRFKLRRLLTFLLILSLGAGVAMESVNFVRHRSIVHIINSMFLGESQVVEQYGTLVNNLINLYSSKSDKEMIKRLQYGKEQHSSKESQDKPNFVFIQVESLDANVIGQQYKGKYIAPYLNALAKENFYYPYTVSYHLGGGTSDCEFSVINSLHPLSIYPSIKLSSYDYPNSFVSMLKKASYETLAFHGNVGRFYNRDVAFPKMGFDDFFDIDKMKMKNIGWGASDQEVFNFSLDRLKSVKQPFLSYVITMSSHGPFNLINQYYTNNAYKDISDTLVKDYFNSMSYVDLTIHDYVSAIMEKYKNTYVFIFGDHDPNVEKDLYKQASVMFGGKRYEFVPLIIITPDHKKHLEQQYATSFLDVAPSVLNASGIRFSLRSDGEDLLRGAGLSNKIPIRGTNFDRIDLFQKIRK